MAYYLGKKEGLGPSILGNLGLNMNKSVTTSPLASSTGYNPLAGGTTGTNKTTQEPDPACLLACTQAHYRALAAIKRVPGWENSPEAQAADAEYRRCSAACSGQNPPIDEEEKPCSQICDEQFSLDHDVAKHAACLAACNVQPGPEGCKTDCANQFAIDHDQQKYDACLAACDKTPTPDTGCGQGAGPTYSGCPSCGKKYMANPGEACKPGYVPVQKSNGIQCECSKWCVDIGWGADCVTQTGGETEPMADYQYPQELQDLYGRLMGRANTFLGMKPGFGTSAITNMFGSNYDKIRRTQTLADQATQAGLQEQGMLGTGVGDTAMRQNAWKTEEQVADLSREIMLANEAQKREDIVSFTDSANKLFQAGLTYEQIREAINAGRRGEGQASLALLLQYLLGMASSYGA